MLEAGSDSPGTDSWPPAFIASIAEETTVCTYDRLGTGSGSSAPPDQPRIFEDLVGILDGVLAALELEPPYVMAGQSAGGNIVIAYAEAHPDRVAALVPIEAYHDDPAEVMAWQADEGFTWEDNPEHIDIVGVAVEQDAYVMPFGEFPVLVITATEDGPEAAENQAHWLGSHPTPGRWSSRVLTTSRRQRQRKWLPRSWTSSPASSRSDSRRHRASALNGGATATYARGASALAERRRGTAITHTTPMSATIGLAVSAVDTHWPVNR